MSRCGCPVASPVIVAGVLVCGVCKLPPVMVVEHVEPEVSSLALPLDCRSADAFNRACREGRVHGARKLGRVWICSRAAWEARTRTAPNVPPASRAKARATRLAPPTTPAVRADELDADTLTEMGATRRAG